MNNNKDDFSIDSEIYKFKNAIMLSLQTNNSLYDSIVPLINDVYDKGFNNGISSHGTIENNEEWYTPADIPTCFEYIKVVINEPRELDGDDIDTVTNALGYALRQYIRGEEISLARVIVNTDDLEPNVLEFSYDASKTQSDDPDYVACFEAAKDYIINGSPLRVTDRMGKGTKNTRLVYGLEWGFEPEIEFYVK